MNEETLGIKNLSAPHPNGEQNIFHIWKENGEKLPLIVRRRNRPYYTVVEKIEVKKWPYGNAYGYPIIDGQYSNHYEYDNSWRRDGLIPCAGCYQWTYVENVSVPMTFSVITSRLLVNKTPRKQKAQTPEKLRAYTFDEIHVKYPKAYAKWSPEDDEKLKNLYQSGKTNDELAYIFQRKTGAIESRLVKLGLTEKTK